MFNADEAPFGNGEPWAGLNWFVEGWLLRRRGLGKWWGGRFRGLCLLSVGGGECIDVHIHCCVEIPVEELVIERGRGAFGVGGGEAGKVG